MLLFFVLGRTINRERGGTLGIQALGVIRVAWLEGQAKTTALFCQKTRDSANQFGASDYLMPKAEPEPP